MPKIKYINKRFSAESMVLINRANKIIEEYTKAGYDLTLRQLYYQFVARGLIANSMKEYKRLGSVINDARLAGQIDWNVIEDRTRGIETLPTWQNPPHVINSAARWYRTDVWASQPFRMEVWIEKEALASVFERVCNEWRVPYLSCRGYTSQSEMWRAGQRLIRYINQGKRIVILHFGDHDPSGIDMSRDIQDRLKMFLLGAKFQFIRMALNFEQVQEHNPPPNPAKTTDSRSGEYIRLYGDESWELDALNPAILSEMVERHVTANIDKVAWDAAMAAEEKDKEQLQRVADNWEDVLVRLN